MSPRATVMEKGTMFRIIKHIGLAALVAALVQTGWPSLAQQQPANSTEAKQDVILVETNEVMIDVVARDKKGRPVRDLRPDEIEIYEDGVRQKVAGFQLVETDGAQPSLESKNETPQSSSAQNNETPRKEAAIIYQQVRLPTGVWLPSLIRMNAAGDDQLFNGLNWDVLFEMSDYKRFDIGVDKIEIDSSKEQK